MNDFDRWLERAWAEHGDAPQAVADRVAALEVTDAAQSGPVARLAAHVFGEHLGQWQAGIAVLDALPAADAVAGQRAVLRHMAGDAQALAALAGDARITALAQVAAMATGRGEHGRAIGALRAALALAETSGLADGSPALRALAVAGNNLAAALEERPQRSDDEERAMLQAAEAGLWCWRRAGGWLEHERAAYRLARSQLAAGQPEAALDSAALCLQICEAQDAPPFERFFAHGVLAMARRAAGDRPGFESAREAARRARDALADDERAWCDDDWALIDIEGPR